MTRYCSRIYHDDPRIKPYIDIISELGGTSRDGALWDDIIDRVDQEKLSRDGLEEAVSGLMDQGDLYEPILDRIAFAVEVCF